MPRTLVALLTAATLLAGTSCAMLGQVKPEDLRVKVLDVDVGVPRSGGLPLDFKVLITNFTSSDLDIRGLAFRLKVNDVQAVEGRLETPIVLASEDQVEVDLPLTVKYEELGQNLKSLVRLEKSRYQLTGEVLVGWLLGEVEVPFERSGTVGLTGVH